jgi:hypothetical protein
MLSGGEIIEIFAKKIRIRLIFVYSFVRNDLKGLKTKAERKLVSDEPGRCHFQTSA